MKSRTLLLVIAGLWAAAATVFALAGGPSRAPASALPIVVLGLSIVALVAVKRVPSLRQGLIAMPTRALLAVHLVRFIGIAFLVLATQGRLPALFAQRAGWGDIAAAVGAVALLVWPRDRGFRPALVVWTIFGALDLLVAVGTATWLNATVPGSMATMLQLPFALVPLWIVPVLFTTHAELLRRARRGELTPPTSEAAAERAAATSR
jgi:hypothetical protein